MKFSLKSILIGAILSVFVLSASAQPAQPGIVKSSPAFSTNLISLLPSAITAGAYSNVSSGTFPSFPIIVNPGFGAGISYKYFNALTTSTTNVGLFINVTPDGSNWLSPPPYYFELKHVANTTNWTGTNMPAAWFDGFMDWRVEGVTNCDTANAITNPANGGLMPSRKRLDYQ